MGKVRQAVSTLESGIRGYTRWREALWTDDTLREITRWAHWDIRATAEVIALRGANGRGCVIGMNAAAARLGCGRHTAGEHRTELIRLGWLAVTGKAGRCPVLDITPA